MNETPAPRCLNCGAPFDGPRPRFCPACGQETNLKPPTLREFAQQFGGAYFSTEGALWRTLGLLVARPGELTRRYLAGRRKHYVLPLRLYLTISLLVLLALKLSSSVMINVNPGQSPQAVPRDVRLALGAGSAGLRDGVFFCERLPAWMCRRIQRRVDVDPRQYEQQVKDLGERFVGNLGAAMFVLVPGFAAWLKLAYLNRRLRFTEHLVFALHVHAFWFLMIGLVLAPTEWVAVPALVAVPLYTLAAMKRVYGGRWWTLLLRGAFTSLAYLVTLGLALGGVGLWAILG